MSRWSRVLSVIVVALCVISTVDATSGAERNVTQRHEQQQRRTKRWTIAEIRERQFPNLVSGDIDMDPCKGEGFIGDIALPNVQYDAEWKAQTMNKSYREVLEKYKKEIFMEGLQVEEEGLVGIQEDKVIYDETRSLEKDLKNDAESQSTLIRESSTQRPRRTRKAHKQNKSTKKKKKNNKKKNEKEKLDEGGRSKAKKGGGGGRGSRKENKRPKLAKQRRDRRPPKEEVDDDEEGEEEKASKVMSTRVNEKVDHLRKAREVPKREVDDDNDDDDEEEEEEEEKASMVVSTGVNEKVDHLRKAREVPKKRRREDVTEGDEASPRDSETYLPEHHQPILTEMGPKFVGVEQRSHGRVTRAATARKERIWDFGVIPYEIDGNFSGGHKALFKQAMRHWENFTCVKFVERVPTEHPNYIVFTERPCGCCSFVGKRGNGPQAISIGKNCDKFGIVVHELGHVVGFWHEHTRPDRDHHVVIIRDNIMAGQEYNFNKLTEEEVNSLGLGYDYDSIMHYARNTFSKGTYLDTILPMETRHSKKRPEIGQRVRLSEGDIAQTNLLYKCYRCGRTLQDNAGTFSSPAHPNSSPPNDGERCEWRITATHGEKIVLNITEIDVFSSDNCKTDYLEIRDGYWHKSPVLGRFCGSGRIHDVITTTGSRMLVTYITSNRQNGHRGFTANYEAVCGGDLELGKGGGTLESPNYPEDYQPNKECIWRLSVPKAYQLALKFQSFEVENHDNCVYDYVEIRDGHSADSPLIGVYCGYKLPPDIQSTGNQLLVKFMSDGSVQKAGFSATFMKEFDECALKTHGCEHNCTNTLGGYKCSCKIGFELHSDGKHCEDACGGVYDVSNGTITSPSFPEIYPPNKMCVWEIIAPPQYRITLNFTHFDLEGNNVFQQQCEYDSVSVFSKMGEDVLRKHGGFCGTRLPPLVTSEGNALRIEFSSDNSVSKSGFAAIFLTDMDECASNNGGCQHECRNTIGSYVCWCHNGFTLHENGHDCKEGGCKYEIAIPTGTVTSPNYPDYYPSRKDCVWHFTTTPGHRIKLMFTEFELEPHQECAYDHVVIYDGDTADSHTLGRFCGSKVPHPILATSNQMLMVFKSDASVQRKGFHATHSTACGGHLQAGGPVRHLYSHAKYGDHNYENRADCDWAIEAPPGKNVHLTFLTFEVEDETDCNYDFVEVYSGLDSSGLSYGRFCGNSNPTDIISMNEALLVRFRSDDSIVSKGFSAAFTAFDPQDSDEMAAKLAQEEDEDENEEEEEEEEEEMK